MNNPWKRYGTARNDWPGLSIISRAEGIRFHYVHIVTFGEFRPRPISARGYMTKRLKILALIPARGGSKGIPGKNIFKLNGHPLIAYSIAVAKLSKYINRIIVTTDDKIIAGISREYGAEAPFLRPRRISGDNSLDIEFFLHALDWLKRIEGYIPNLIVHLRPTTPLRDVRVVDRAILEIIKDIKATSLRSAEILDCESPYKLFKKKGPYYEFFGKEDFKTGEEYYNYPRQRFPSTYRPNGYVDIVRPKVLFETGLLHGKYIRAFITDKVADIDSLKDFEIAQRLLCEPQFRYLRDMLKRIKRRGIYGDCQI